MITVRVPATSANLGPGFDCLGLALPLFNRLTLAPAERLAIENVGPEAGGLPTDGSHLAHRAAARLCERVGRELPAWSLKMDVAIPQARGLGSSSAAIVAGLLAANAFWGSPLDTEGLLQLASEMEGHPDNVAPALFGGVTAAFEAGGAFRCLRLAATPPCPLVFAVPDFELSTEQSRKALPAQVPMADAVANVASVTALTTVMLGGPLEWLPHGLTDRLHQPYRLGLIRGAGAVVDSAREAGAWGTVVSGAGPTLLAFCRAGREAEVALAMQAAWRQAGVDCRTHVHATLAAGARVEPE